MLPATVTVPPANWRVVRTTTPTPAGPVPSPVTGQLALPARAGRLVPPDVGAADSPSTAASAMSRIPFSAAPARPVPTVIVAFVTARTRSRTGGTIAATPAIPAHTSVSMRLPPSGRDLHICPNSGAPNRPRPGPNRPHLRPRRAPGGLYFPD